MSFIYFGYGSNMLSGRLSAATRCPSAKPLGIAVVEGYYLDFSKPSKDGSGKAAIWKSPRPASIVYGVLFEIEDGEVVQLDGAEAATGRNPGYKRVEGFEARLYEDNTVIPATTYLALDRDCSLHPYDWYLALVLAGAKENLLPSAYFESLRRFQFHKDETLGSKGRLEAIEVLQKAGHEDWQSLLPTTPPSPTATK